MDLLLLGALFGSFGYPFVVAFVAFWVSRQILSNPSLTLWPYCQQGILVALMPPLLLVLLLALLGLADYKGFCSGWLDSGSRPCSIVKYFQLQLFWGAMLGFVPSLVGLGLTFIAFWWHWTRHQTSLKGSTPNPTDSTG
jgi:hypothetical protein